MDRTSTNITSRRPALTQHSNHISYAQAVKIDSGRQLLSSAQCLRIYDLFVSELLKCRNIEEQIRTIARLSFEQVSKYLQRHD